MEQKIIQQRIGERLGIATFTPMQKEVAALTAVRRLILLSPTGSGKTVAFVMPFLKAMDSVTDIADTEVRGVVLVPTRELAMQVFEVVRTVAAPELKTAVLYGGHSFATEQQSLAGKPHIVVGTPGRVLDHIRRGSLNVFSVKALVLDEYDKSLELGFLHDMKAIVGRMKNVSTLVLTSATRLRELPDFLGDAPFKVLDYSGADHQATPKILFRKVESPSADKLDILDALLRDLGGKRVIVFVNHRDAAERVYNSLIGRGFPAGMYHGGLEQDKREKALTLFANGTTPVLVSTDLASRGLDIGHVGAVVHYHLPVNTEAMTHRNGRTGRMGAEGEAFAIVSEHDKVPDFFPALDNYWPAGKTLPAPSATATLFFNVGKKDKISRGDIVGFLINKGGLSKEEVGRIDLGDHHAYVAVPGARARAAAVAVAPYKIKNTRVRVTQLK